MGWKCRGEYRMWGVGLVSLCLLFYPRVSLASVMAARDQRRVMGHWQAKTIWMKGLGMQRPVQANRLQHLCLPPHLFERPKPTPCVTMKFANQHLQRHTWGYRDARSEPAPPSLNHASKPSAQSFFTSGSRCAAPAATQQPRLCTRRFSPLLKRVSAKRSALDGPVMATTCPRQLRFSALKHSALPLKGFWATNLNTLSPWDRVCSPLDDEDRTACTYNNQHGSEWSATSSSEAERGEISSFPGLMLLTVTGEPRAYGRLAFRVSGCRSYYATSFLRNEDVLGPGRSCLNLAPSAFWLHQKLEVSPIASTSGHFSGFSRRCLGLAFGVIQGHRHLIIRVL